MTYQPKTGQPCGCKRGQQRDNCPECEGTGQRIDFQALRQGWCKPCGFPRHACLNPSEHVNPARADRPCPRCFSPAFWVGWSRRVRAHTEGSRDVVGCSLCGHAWRYARRDGRMLTMKPGTFAVA